MVTISSGFCCSFFCIPVYGISYTSANVKAVVQAPQSSVVLGASSRRKSSRGTWRAHGKGLRFLSDY